MLDTMHKPADLIETALTCETHCGDVHSWAQEVEHIAVFLESTWQDALDADKYSPEMSAAMRKRWLRVQYLTSSLEDIAASLLKKSDEAWTEAAVICRQVQGDGK